MDHIISLSYSMNVYIAGDKTTADQIKISLNDGDSSTASMIPPDTPFKRLYVIEGPDTISTIGSLNALVSPRKAKTATSKYHKKVHSP